MTSPGHCHHGCPPGSPCRTCDARMPFVADYSRGPDYPGRYSVPRRKRSWQVQAVLLACALVDAIVPQRVRDWGRDAD